MDDVFSIQGHWLAGALAKAAGVSTDTLRHYERKGVLKRPVRARNGYRLYPENSLDRVLLVRKALSFGFTLDELALILTERDKGSAPCRKVRSLVAEKLSDVEVQLKALAVLRDELRLTLNDWDKRLSESPADAPVHLLKNFVSVSDADTNSGNDQKKKKIPSPKSKK